MGLRNRIGPGSSKTVLCVACGERVARSDAREYDKFGDRWDREGKEFEYLCKPCYGEYCNYPRDGLEATLTRAGAGTVSQSEFLRRYCALAEQHGSSE